MLDALNCVNSDLFLLGKCQNRGTKLTHVSKFWEFFGFGFCSSNLLSNKIKNLNIKD